MNSALSICRRLAVLLVVTVVVLLGSGCAGAKTGQELAHVADPIVLPAPTGAVVLTIHGPGLSGDKDGTTLDLAGIESIGTKMVVIYDPFVNASLTVTGVELDRLLGAAGVAPDAQLAWTALDDYTVGFSRDAAAAEDAILVTRVDGHAIAVEDGGPIRVVFPADDGPLGRDTNQWIWSLSQITVG